MLTQGFVLICPRYDLQRARDDLVLSLNSGYDRDLEAAMPILGIPNRYIRLAVVAHWFSQAQKLAMFYMLDSCLVK